MVLKVKDAQGDPTDVDTCMPSMGAKIDINLAARITDAGSRFQALNPESDNYADELAELRAEFSGPVMDALFEESVARRATVAARKKFEDARELFTTARETDATSGGEEMLYNDLAVGSDADAPESPTVSIIGGVTFTTDQTQGPNRGKVTAVRVENLNVLTGDVANFTESTDIEDIMGLKTIAEADLKNAQAALKAVTDGELVLTTATIDAVNDVVTFRTDEIQKLADLITDIEGARSRKTWTPWRRIRPPRAA